jgi:hypothetical protein
MEIKIVLKNIFAVTTKSGNFRKKYFFSLLVYVDLDRRCTVTTEKIKEEY